MNFFRKPKNGMQSRPERLHVVSLSSLMLLNGMAESLS